MLRSFTYKGIPVWRHAQVIQWAIQIVSGVLVVALVAWFLANIGNAIQDRDIPYGFSFLDREYQTPIGQSLPGLRVVRHLPLRLHRRGYQHRDRLRRGRGAGHCPGGFRRRFKIVQ